MFQQYSRLMEVSCGHPRASALTPASVMLPQRPRLMDVSRGNIPLCATKRSQSSRTTMASFPQPPTPNTKCSTFNVHTHVFHRGDMSRLRITFLTPLVHCFGAQYSTIFPRYMWEHVVINGPVRSRPNSRAMCCTKYSEKSPLHNRN